MKSIFPCSTQKRKWSYKAGKHFDPVLSGAELEYSLLISSPVPGIIRPGIHHKKEQEASAFGGLNVKEKWTIRFKQSSC